MNIISWNCNMAFRKKWSTMMELQPDILVIQECEHESKYTPNEIIPDYNQFLWFGDNTNKGIGILSFNGYEVALAADYDPSYRYVVPLKITGEIDCYLLAVWAMPDPILAHGYVGQLWRALHHYESLLVSNCIICGDWNSNQIWDASRKSGNHSDVIALLHKYNIESLYHLLHQVGHGREPDPTIYLLKQESKPYHLDYCAASDNLINRHTTIRVGMKSDWIKLSDHMPLIVEHLGPWPQ